MRRGTAPGSKANPERLGLPARPFLYTLDQIGTLLSLEVKDLKLRYLYFEGRSTGVRSMHLIQARNIAHPTSDPDWRVAERELLRWLKLKGFRVYDLQVVTN